MEKTKNFPDEKSKIKYLEWKTEKKHKMHDVSTKILLPIIFMLISSSVNLCIFYSLRKEEQLVALLVYSSFRRVATSGIRNSSVATSSVSRFQLSRAQMRSDYGVTPYSP